MKFSCIFCTSLLTLLASCSSGDGGDSGNGDGALADGGALLDASHDSVVCATKPTRLIVLGDSIAACVKVDGKDAATCGPKIFSESLAAGYAPNISYENLSVPGAVTTDVVDNQLATIAAGSGHPLVLIYIGGNDLQKYLLASDADATAGFTSDLPGIIEDWNSIFAYFSDTANFPDGATILMNNQYSPFDNCTAEPYNVSSIKNAIIVDFNNELKKLADAHDNVVITDQYTPYLGHGHHYQVTTCPSYQAGLVPFMSDLIHPNPAGHANLATQWDLMADSLYSGCE